MLNAIASSSRLYLRGIATSSRNLQKAPLLPSREVPTPAEFLTLIGRGVEKRLGSQVESWESLSEIWKKGGKALKNVGLGVRERRWVNSSLDAQETDEKLWAMAKYSQGISPSTFIKPPRPAKKIRGWGPRVQNGVRVKK
ncbi:hypothetical protein TREMEDRAFT_35843 [Tremella mesenterica DSM 1558]|uniref:uncharacterized protein n=1 Tax=Tremella mesenterica (strain ATCC 24925 / CBS 8224 / DSM 1558 / NBRC 9311 / NRRL Y-6157 / RJB 2259-6 / UBC 559-6) TaxID=578456 RepID=UPI00032C80DE|nr:uncharacterized protein TREMEDRAFT_35843 [Tremella mesenterica DSM 1558]EIW65826.1 hypothetical protein TREMEDRAFT_35843 [Tremella mesenterica DSM 1558]